MQQHAEFAMKRHLSEDLQPQFDKNNKTVKRYPFSNTNTEKEVNASIRRARKSSDRYYNMNQRGVPEK